MELWVTIIIFSLIMGAYCALLLAIGMAALWFIYKVGEAWFYLMRGLIRMIRK